MVAVACGSALIMLPYALYMYRLDKSRRADRKTIIELSQLATVCVAFADFTTDITWGLKILRDDGDDEQVRGWAAHRVRAADATPLLPPRYSPPISTLV